MCSESVGLIPDHLGIITWGSGIWIINVLSGTNQATLGRDFRGSKAVRQGVGIV